MHNIYIRIDCDNVGDKIEFALYNDDPETAQKISDSIKINIKWLIDNMNQISKGKVLLIGSDDILFETNEEFFNIQKLENLRQEFFMKTNITLSIGVGISIIDALTNLNIAKISGKNRIILNRHSL
ncbi:mCpol domain-containing protein [Flavobacterium sp. 102]|uniref:mCpol domain-containing protein n=1 Tax=Flavobacterium sp. 102 TaxID=2135623 RepID=UPI000EABAAF4|nr:mCpol domain-containing protein [Flavobacterium sp. 102]RKS03587.1 hypothetical protein C8C84_3348 [Flavobacterium sp. 102]